MTSHFSSVSRGQCSVICKSINVHDVAPLSPKPTLHDVFLGMCWRPGFQLCDLCLRKSSASVARVIGVGKGLLCIRDDIVCACGFAAAVAVG